jgi:hypothetical protein
MNVSMKMRLEVIIDGRIGLVNYGETVLAMLNLAQEFLGQEFRDRHFLESRDDFFQILDRLARYGRVSLIDFTGLQPTVELLLTWVKVESVEGGKEGLEA